MTNALTQKLTGYSSPDFFSAGRKVKTPSDEIEIRIHDLTLTSTKVLRHDSFKGMKQMQLDAQRKNETEGHKIPYVVTLPISSFILRCGCQNGTTEKSNIVRVILCWQSGSRLPYVYSI
jgi:hypothetical protein